VGPGGAVDELGVRLLERGEAAVVERVEDQLAGEPEQVERPRAVLGDEAPGRREVLAGHDLGRLDRPVLRRGVLLPHPLQVERAARTVVVRAGLQPLPDRWLGVVDQPGGPLHDVGVGVVHDPALDVRHRNPLVQLLLRLGRRTPEPGIVGGGAHDRPHGP